MTEKKRTQQAVSEAIRGAKGPEPATIADQQRQTRAERERERYATDPEYRAQKQAKNAAWKAQNREKQREYNAKWQAQHGAEASKRYRQRQQENEHG